MECALNLDGVDQADDFAVTQGPNQTEHLSQSADILVGPEGMMQISKKQI